ncbi:MAG: O-antigen ligase family protein [Pirellulales bacterium]|nr:O-antigen ligase family protein [Pirellulales bacterium]
MEILILILGIAGIVWGAVLLRRGGLLAGCLLVMLAGACFSVPFFKLELGPVPLTADRVLLAALVGLYVFWRQCTSGGRTFLSGIKATGRNACPPDGIGPGHYQMGPKPLGKPEILLCLLIAAVTVSMFSADYARADYQPVSWLIIYYLMPFTLYWIARQMPLDERHLTVLYASFALFGVYLAVTSLAEYFGWWPLVFPRYIVETARQAEQEFVGRARGPFLNPISNGIALSICLAAVLMLWPRVGRRVQVLLLPAAALLLAAIGATLTRTAWLSGALVLVLIVGLAIPRNWRLPLLTAGLILAVTVAAVHWEQLMTFKRDRDLAASKTAESVALRPVLARIAWEMFLDRPLFGCGYGQYSAEHLYYLSDRSTGLVLEKGRGYIPHNVVLSLLAETGLVGLGLFLAVVGYWARDAWLLWSDRSAPLGVRQQGLLMLTALSVYFLNGTFHEVSVTPMTNMTLFFLAGVTAGLRPQSEGCRLCFSIINTFEKKDYAKA